MLILLFLFVVATGAWLWHVSRRPLSSPDASRRRTIVIVARSVLIAVAAWLGWGMLLMGGIVQVDPIFRSLGVKQVELSWIPWIVFAPPILVAVACGVMMARRNRV